MYSTVIGQAIELLRFKVGVKESPNGNLLTSEIFGNMRLISPKMMSYLTSHNFKILKIEIFSKPCKV